MAEPPPPPPLPLPLPRLGDFSEVFRVLTVSPCRQEEERARPSSALSLAWSLSRSPAPSPVPRSKTVRPASRRMSAGRGPAGGSIGFLSGIERYLSPQLPEEEEEEEEEEDDADGDGDDSTTTSETDDGSDDAEAEISPRPASPAVAIVSASTSPATAAAAVVVATPVKRRSLIPKTTPRRLTRSAAAAPPALPPPPTSTAFAPPPPPPPPSLIGNFVVPLRAESRTTKLARIDTRLARLAREPRALAAAATAVAPETPAVHVFVDLSNIAIGFINRLRTERGVPAERRVQEPPLFFGGLAQILERGRQVERRVTAGSVRTTMASPSSYAYGSSSGSDDDTTTAADDATQRTWHAYMVEAKALGYEMNLLRRVPNTPGGHTPGGGGGGGGANAEQAVDEVLQLKMCHSVLDAEPGTLVLATGDGAAAEFSDGFLRHVQRALARNWCVELVAWRQGIAAAWRTLARTHGERFRIVELDAFVHELHGVFREE